MSKSKTSGKAAEPAKSKILKKVKEGGVTKPAQNAKSKTKEIAKKVAVKEEKSKKEKKVKEPTPEPSSSEEEESSESSSSESEVEVKKPAVNGKVKSVKKPAPKDDSSDSSESESESKSESSSEDEAPAAKNNVAKNVGKKANGTTIAKPPAKAAATESESESESESEADSDESSDDDDETPAVAVGAAPAIDKAADESSAESDSSDDEVEEPKALTNGAAKADASAESSDSSEEDDDSDDESSDSSESEEEEEQAEAEPPTKVSKRKAEEQPDRAIKKAKAEAESTATSANPPSTNLFVGNLSWNIDDAWLREVFEEHGELTRVQVMYDKATNRAKGFGYVEYAREEDAKAAFEAKKGFELDGRVMNVDFSSKKPNDGQRQEERRKSYGDQLSPPTSTLFIGNIAFDAGQEQISEAFAPYGTILSVRIPTSQETGQIKGFGYVTFSSVEEATAALDAMQGAYISSRPVRLDYGAEREDRGDSGSRGRGGARGGGRGGFNGRGRGGDRGRGGRGGGGFGARGGRGGGRGASTNRGGFNDFAGRKQTFD